MFIRILYIIISVLVAKNIFAQSDTAIVVPKIKRDYVVQDDDVTWLVEKYNNQNQTKPIINGYRVQIYFDSGNQSKKKANDVKTQFLAKNPDIPCYLVYQSPNFKVRVGDFRTRYEAYKFYREIRNDFPSAYIVKDEINFPKN
jgi:hypothetical protein